jgi:hypothetical protein
MRKRMAKVTMAMAIPRWVDWPNGSALFRLLEGLILRTRFLYLLDCVSILVAAMENFLRLCTIETGRLKERSFLDLHSNALRANYRVK